MNDEEYWYAVGCRTGKTASVFQELTGLNLDDLVEALMTWNYRVIEEAGKFSIHEVFYHNDVPTDMTIDPIYPVGSTLEELIEDVDLYFHASFKKPLKYPDDFDVEEEE